MPVRALIAFYSMSGNTRTVAHELASRVAADLEEIREPRRRQGMRGVVRALVDAVLRREPPIESPIHDPASYDVLMLGGPIWAGRMASPMRTYARRYGAIAPHVAFFCTEGGRGSETAFADLEKLCKQAPDATLVVDAVHLPPDAHHAELGLFASRVTMAQLHESLSRAEVAAERV